MAKDLKGCSNNVGYAGGKRMTTEMAGGGKVQVRGYARGGPVRHSDAKQDAKLVTGMVKQSCIKPGKGK